MSERRYTEWVRSLVLVEDEAFVPGQRIPKQRKSRILRTYDTRPVLTPDERRTYKRDWMRRARGRRDRGLRVVASLHDVQCIGPTTRTGCCCRKTVLYEREA